MMYRAAAMSGPSPVKGLLQGIQHAAGMSGPAHPSADDAGIPDSAIACTSVGFEANIGLAGANSKANKSVRFRDTQ